MSATGRWQRQICHTAIRRGLPSPAADRPDNENNQAVSFQDLGLKKPILDGVHECGYTKPTDIQTRAIPLVLQNRDLIGLGQTGSGKTAAFGLPILDPL